VSKFSFPRGLLTPGQGHLTRFEIIALVLALCFVFDLASHLMNLQEEARLWELASLLFLLGIYGLLLCIRHAAELREAEGETDRIAYTSAGRIGNLLKGSDS
jgi:hypothetical protein